MTESKRSLTKPIELSVSRSETKSDHYVMDDESLEDQALGAVYRFILHKQRERNKESREGKRPYGTIQTAKSQLANQVDSSYDDNINHLERKELTRKR